MCYVSSFRKQVPVTGFRGSQTNGEQPLLGLVVLTFSLTQEIELEFDLGQHLSVRVLATDLTEGSPLPW